MTVDEEERRKHSLTREDLTILLESYRNMIESNLQLNEKQDQILKSIVSVLTFFEDIKDNINKINNHHEKCAVNQLSNYSDLKDLMHTEYADSLRDGIGAKAKLYGLIGILCTIIVGLIGLIYKILNP